MSSVTHWTLAVFSDNSRRPVRFPRTANLWLEESLSETASLFTLRAMSRSWRSAPPYPAWRDYAPSFNDYMEKRLARPENHLPAGTLFFVWFQENLDALRQNSATRSNTIIATQLLAPIRSGTTGLGSFDRRPLALARAPVELSVVSRRINHHSFPPVCNPRRCELRPSYCRIPGERSSFPPRLPRSMRLPSPWAKCRSPMLDSVWPTYTQGASASVLPDSRSAAARRVSVRVCRRDRTGEQKRPGRVRPHARQPLGRLRHGSTYLWAEGQEITRWALEGL